MERDLELSESDGSLKLHDGDTLVAEGHGSGFELEIPVPPELPPLRRRTNG